MKNIRSITLVILASVLVGCTSMPKIEGCGTGPLRPINPENISFGNRLAVDFAQPRQAQ